MMFSCKNVVRLSVAGIVSVLATGLMWRGNYEPPRRPNVVIILADQWNAQSLGYAGNSDVKTPNLDLLASRSVVFSTAVSVMPVCSPARASLLTGQYPLTHDYNSSFYFDENDVRHEWEGYDAFPQTDSAIRFIDRNKNTPFLLMLSWGPPHDPYLTAPEAYRKLYDPEKLKLRPNVPDSLQVKARRDLAGYYAHCTALDKSAGDLLEALKKAGVEENTILLFTSDHGDMLYSQGKVRKQKPWDESVLVPLLVHYPEGLGNGKRELSLPFSNVDILPTLLGMSNLKIPASVEGTNYGDVLAGKRKPTGDEAALIQVPVPFHENNFLNGGKEYRGIRTKQYTYVRDLKGSWLLYDNVKDPYQLNNLVDSKSYARVQLQLEKALRAKLAEAGDRFLMADEYMRQWNYRYDGKDSLRLARF